MKEIKPIISIVAFISAIVLGFIALFLPPTGIIDNSVLWFTAQLLVFVCSLLGVDLTIGKFSTKKKENIE